MNHVKKVSSHHSDFPLPLLWTITGSDVHGHLGWAFTAGNPIGNSSATYVALSIPTKNMSAPHWYDEDRPQAGEVVIFPVDQVMKDFTINEIKALTILQSDQEFSRLGK